MKIIELRKPEQIFVDIREEKVSFKDKYTGDKIEIDEYVLLYSCPGGTEPTNEKFTFLGLNRAFVENEFNNKPTLRKSFWLRNSEVFAGMCCILSAWINEDTLPSKKLSRRQSFSPVDWLKFLEAVAYTIDPKRNWYGFTVDLSRRREIFKGTKLYDFITFLKEEGYTLLISAENGLGGDSSPNIYFQIASNNQYHRNPYLDDLSINAQSLTLEKTNLKVSLKGDPDAFFKIFEKDYSLSSINSIFDKSSDKFLTALENFILLYELMRKINLDRTAYSAIVLDLYDRNRNVSSVDLDRRLQKLINKTIRNGARGVVRDEFNWASLIRSVVINNSEDLITKVQNNPYELGKLDKVTLLYSGELQISGIED